MDALYAAFARQEEEERAAWRRGEDRRRARTRIGGDDAAAQGGVAAAANSGSKEWSDDERKGGLNAGRWMTGSSRDWQVKRTYSCGNAELRKESAEQEEKEWKHLLERNGWYEKNDRQEWGG